MNNQSEIINIIGGPGCGKSIETGLIFGYLKLKGISVDMVLEEAKKMVRKKNWTDLNNQYLVSKNQYQELLMLSKNVDYVITDGSLLQGLVYNEINKKNICNIEKTEKAIIEWYREFNNKVFFIKRNKNIKYETEGRIQNKKEAEEIDILIKKKLKKYNIPFKEYEMTEKTHFEIISEIKRKY